MNSMAVLLLLESLARFGMLAMFAQTALPADLERPTEKDYGWQIGKDGALEYIVQISPQDIQIMMSQNQENESPMPAELVGRATRIVTRIGTDVLPRSPSLAEIERQFPLFNTPSDVTAALGPGRVSDVERAVLPVQGGGSGLALPALPNNPTLDNLTSGMANQANAALDRTNRAAEQLGNRFLDEARQPGSAPRQASPTLPPTTMPGSGLAGGGLAGGVQSGAGNFGAPAPSSGMGNMPTNLPATQGVDRWAAGSNGQMQPTTLPPSTDPRSLGDPYDNLQPQSPSAFPSTSNQRDPYAPNLAQRDQMPGRALSEAVPGSGGFQYADDRFGNGGYATGAPAFNQPPMSRPAPSRGGFAQQYDSSQYDPSQDPLNYGNIAQRDPRAGQRDALSKNVSDDTRENKKSLEEDDSPSSKGASSTPARRGGSENFLQVFFLLSLVVNFYLGMLIRKLLARYRSLLASVRSQAA